MNLVTILQHEYTILKHVLSNWLNSLEPPIQIVEQMHFMSQGSVWKQIM